MRDRDRLGDEREERIENHLGLEARSRYGVETRIMEVAAGTVGGDGKREGRSRARTRSIRSDYSGCNITSINN
jgi:hypothetical protein